MIEDLRAAPGHSSAYLACADDRSSTNATAPFTRHFNSVGRFAALASPRAQAAASRAASAGSGGCSWAALGCSAKAAAAGCGSGAADANLDFVDCSFIQI
jgi:hypothetical protein